MKKIIPLLLVEFYLLTTLLILFLGPVQFALHDNNLFIVLMILYHVSFVVGYLFSSSTYNFNGVNAGRKFSGRFYYVALFFAVLSILISYKNIMLGSSIIPFNLFNDLAAGVTEPGKAYADRMNSILEGNYYSSRLTNVVSFFFGFAKLLFVFIFVYFWSELSLFKKFLSLAYCVFFLFPGISSGTNSFIFLLFIFLSFSIFFVMYARRYRYFYLVFIFLGVLFLVPVGFFGYMMSQRGGGFEYFSSTSPLGDVSVSMQTPGLNGVSDFYSYSLVWLNYYLVQGYYGFSLILNLDWDWTFGLGNSAFLQRQLFVISGVDISGLTYQAKISHLWDKDAQWHSFYGHFANDFGFLGLSVLMLLLGYFLSRAWLTAVYDNSFYGAALIPILALMFIFFPANNQVFGFIDTLSYIFFISLFWIFEGKRMRCK